MRKLTRVVHFHKTFWASLCIYLHTLVALWPPIDFSLNLTKQKKNVQQQRAFSFYSKSLFSLCNCICILWAKRNECRILLILAGLIDPSFSTARQSSLHGDILAVALGLWGILCNKSYLRRIVDFGLVFCNRNNEML